MKEAFDTLLLENRKLAQALLTVIRAAVAAPGSGIIEAVSTITLAAVEAGREDRRAA